MSAALMSSTLGPDGEFNREGDGSWSEEPVGDVFMLPPLHAARQPRRGEVERIDLLLALEALEAAEGASRPTTQHGTELPLDDGVEPAYAEPVRNAIETAMSALRAHPQDVVVQATSLGLLIRATAGLCGSGSGTFGVRTALDDGAAQLVQFALAAHPTHRLVSAYAEAMTERLLEVGVPGVPLLRVRRVRKRVPGGGKAG